MFFLAPLLAAPAAASGLAKVFAVAAPLVKAAIEYGIAQEVTKQVAIKGTAVVVTTAIGGAVAYSALSSDADAQVKVGREGVEAGVKHH